jgi:hypothetical protein
VILFRSLSILLLALLDELVSGLFTEAQALSKKLTKIHTKKKEYLLNWLEIKSL